MTSSRPWHTLRHFTRGEWGPGDAPERVAWDLVRLMDDVREAAGVPITIHEAWAESGHAPKSYHYTGLACDFHFKPDDDFRAADQYDLLSEFLEIGGMGYYPGWNQPGWHIDLRPGNRRRCWIMTGDQYFYGCGSLRRGLDILESIR